MPPQIITAPSGQVRDVCAQWLADNSEVRLVVIEAMMGAGKSTITAHPFVANDGSLSNTIGVDQFLTPFGDVRPETAYVEALDQARLRGAVSAALQTYKLVIVEGAIAWPLIETIALGLERGSARRVYLKRMSRLIADYWRDEDQIASVSGASNYSRSICRYHAEQKPWLMADLVLQRIEHDDE